MKKINFYRLVKISRAELMENHGLTFDIDFGDSFFNSLFWGTLKTLADRVDSSGFCQTSYGECGNIKCYGMTHYPRDTAEAARVLAMVGLFDKANTILDFTLNNIPQGQTYIPHVYNSDGSIRANTVQVDTPGIIATALGKLIELQGCNDSLKRKYDKLAFIFREMWKTHFHEKLNLLDAGNYNEQFCGGEKRICDIFTNSAFYAGLTAMKAAAAALGENESVEENEEKIWKLTQGIEQNLFDEEQGVYRSYIDPLGLDTGELNWHSFYCSRWYPMRPQALEKTFEILRSQTTLKIGPFNIISCEMNQDHEILGKIFSRLIGYLAQTGKRDLLEEHLNFARRTIRKPANVFPERWYLTEQKNPSEYWKDFWKKYKDIWKPYDQAPDGDYTVDSGNCEQCSVFLAHMIEDLSGMNLSTLKIKKHQYLKILGDTERNPKWRSSFDYSRNEMRF
jgi:hypothetical protein